MQRSRRTGIAACAGAAAVIVLVAAAARAEIIDRVLAMVGTQVVTQSDLRATEAFGLIPQSASAGTTDLVGQLVNRQLMLSEVERYSAPDPERQSVERRVAEIRATFHTAADYEQALARTAMSDERLRSVVADNVRIEFYVEQRFAAAAQPTAEEVQRYYREHAVEFTTNGRLAAFEDVQVIAQQKAAAERKRALIIDWLDRLRRRGGVTARDGGR
jgi:hypothetical protein